MNSEVIANIVLAVLSLLSVIVTGVIVPYVKSRTELNKRENAYAIVQFAVNAAEQIFKNQSGAGENKHKMVTDYLRSKGINVDSEDVKIMIEAAVREANKWTKELVSE